MAKVKITKHAREIEKLMFDHEHECYCGGYMIVHNGTFQNGSYHNIKAYCEMCYAEMTIKQLTINGVIKK